MSLIGSAHAPYVLFILLFGWQGEGGGPRAKVESGWILIDKFGLSGSVEVVECDSDGSWGGGQATVVGFMELVTGWARKWCVRRCARGLGWG